MKDVKKTRKANLEHRRWEMFLVAMVLVLSLLYCALEWNITTFNDNGMTSIEDIIEDIDLSKVKKDYDMVATVTEMNITKTVKNVVIATEVEQMEELVSPSDEEIDGIGEDHDVNESVIDLPPQLLITNINDNERLIVMERLPEFPGGASAFMKWITANVKYPKAVRDKSIEGKVVVSFIVDAEGDTKKLRIEESSNQILGSLVISVLSKMPKWTPGVQNGKVCSTMIKIPINFEL